MYLSVCVSDSAHALIGRQPSRDVTSSTVYKGCEGGGTTDCRHAYELHGLHERITRYLYSVYGIVVSVSACHA